MSEDWDLFAIVRSCQSPTSTAKAESNQPTTTSAATTADSTILSQDTTFTVWEQKESFTFPNPVQPRTNEFQELNQLFMPINPSPTSTTTTTTTTSGNSTNPNSLFSHFEGSIWPHFVPEASTSGFNRFHDQQQQQLQHDVRQQQQQNQLQVVHQKQEFQVPRSGSPIDLPDTQLTLRPRSRKRKSQQKRMVCHVTADNLSTDLWAWRKYGQKPIKGSPYPRNYYRCSSSKGCVARKQVERSTTEPDMFTVTYTGDHSHPRPTHRNSLAGSTRSKPSTSHLPMTYGSGSGSPSNQANVASSSSPEHSATAPLTGPPENDAMGVEDPIGARASESPDREMEPELAAEDDVPLIPNTGAMSEDFFLGLDHFGDDSGGAGNSDSSESPSK